MPRRKNKPALLPYRKFRIWFPGQKKKYYYGYWSLLTNSRISKSVASKNKTIQGLREAYPDYEITSTAWATRGKKIKIHRTDETRLKIKATIAEFKKIGMNALEESPSLARYFKYLREKKPKLYKAAVLASGLKGQADLTPFDIENYTIPPRKKRKPKRRRPRG